MTKVFVGGKLFNGSTVVPFRSERFGYPLWTNSLSFADVSAKTQHRSFPRPRTIRSQNSISHSQIVDDGIFFPSVSTFSETNSMRYPGTPIRAIRTPSGVYDIGSDPLLPGSEISYESEGLYDKLYFCETGLYGYAIIRKTFHVNRTEDLDWFFPNRTYTGIRRVTYQIRTGPGTPYQCAEDVIRALKNPPAKSYPRDEDGFLTVGTFSTKYFVDSGPIDLPPLFVSRYEVLHQLKRVMPPVSWNENMTLLAQSTRDIQFNSIEFLAGLKSLKSLADIPKGISPKDLANGYLWKKYGLDNVISDIRAVLSIKRASRTHLVKRSRVTTSCSYKGRQWERLQCLGVELPSLDANASKVGRFLDKFEKLSLAPTAGRLWDLIPYSFVVDWILPIGDLLSSIDNRAYLSTLKPRVVVKSVTDKTIIDGPTSPGYTFFGTSYFKRYTRRVSRSLPPVDWVLDPGSLSTSEIVTGGALIIQRR